MVTVVYWWRGIFLYILAIVLLVWQRVVTSSMIKIVIDFLPIHRVLSWMMMMVPLILKTSLWQGSNK